jgi:negative regulator of sigma E activity
MSPADDIDAMQLTPDPDKLLAYHRQQLSAMLDGELSPDQAKFMLRRLQHDGELAACWDRWQVCGDMLRGHHHALLPSDFAARVARGIAEDARMSAGPSAMAADATPARRLRWGGGAALAASVALAAVFAPRLFDQSPEPAPYPGASPVLAASQPAPTADPTADPPGTPPAAGDALPTAAAALAPAVLATAVAAAEAPRRSAERRARTAPQRAAATAPRSEALPLVATNGPVPALVDPQQAFPAPPPLQVRPWPRAVLSGSVDPRFSVGYGAMAPTLSPVEDAYDPRFLPRTGLPLVLAPAADDSGDAAEPPERSTRP